MLHGDGVTRDMLAELLRSVIDGVVGSQLARGAQEPQISSKIADRLEDRLNGVEINGFKITARAQDFRDRGRDADESKSGADLYLGLRVEPRRGLGLPIMSKGLLIQAKKRDVPKFSRIERDERAFRMPKTQADLLKQCEKMLMRTDKGAFVWVYGSAGTHVVPASEVLKHRSMPPEFLAGRNVAEQFRDVLDCFSGDQTLTASHIFDDDFAFGAYLREIAVKRGVTIALTERT